MIVGASDLGLSFSFENFVLLLSLEGDLFAAGIASKPVFMLGWLGMASVAFKSFGCMGDAFVVHGCFACRCAFGIGGAFVVHGCFACRCAFGIGAGCFAFGTHTALDAFGVVAMESHALLTEILQPQKL